MQLRPPTGMTVDEATTALQGVLSVRVRPERGRDCSYYDTFDGLLHADGLELWHEAGELVLAARAHGGEVLARAACARPRPPMQVEVLPAGELRDALRAIVDVRALLALVRLQGRERALDVLDEEEKTVVRLLLSAPEALGPQRARVALAVRVSVQGLRGYDEELERVRALLAQELFFTPVAVGLVDEAVLALGGRPGGVSSKAQVPLEAEQSSAGAVVAVLRAQLAIIEANLPGTLADVDTEFLHDLRVAVRRTRAVQRECRDVFEAERLARFRTEFRWLQQATGDARDMDVYLLGFDALRAMVAPALQADLAPLLAVLRSRHRRAHAAMRRALRSERATGLLEDWRAFLVELEAGFGGPAAVTPISELAGARIRTVYRRMVAMGDAIGPDSPAEDYHELRKKGKELRYLLELFGAELFGAEVVRPLIKTLKGLQDVLGRHQDREVQAATLRGLSSEIARLPGGAEALVAVGALVQRLADDEVGARSEFARSFAPFAAPEQRRLVRETFR